MKKFLLISVVLFILSGVATTAVFFFVKDNVQSVPFVTETVTAVNSVLNKETTEPVKEATIDTQNENVPENGIALSTLPLTEVQKKALRAANIDVDTFIITPPMLTCASEKVGAQRVDAFSTGEAPTLIEITKLLPCLSGS